MHRSMTLTRTAALGLLLGALACQNDTLLRPSTLTPIDPMFTRYVSMGNSITAGFQSAGINDSTQVLAYGVLLAKQMRTPYFQPLLNRPGCPPPIVNVFLRTVVGPPLNPALPCALRKPQPVPPPFLNDVAVPGAGTEDVITNLSPNSSPNTLTTIILGGLSQSQAMQRANPTFVSAWIGNNDVLGPATDTANAGNPAELLTATVFNARYDSILDAIDQTAAKGKGVLLGVNDVTTIPYFSLGSVYLGAKLAGGLPATFIVSLDCAPQSLGGVGDTTLVPFRYGFGLIAAAQAGATDTLDCLNDHNITPSELANLHSLVAAYNQHIGAQATSRGYAFIDPNPLILQVKADTSQFALFPHANPADPKFTTAPFGNAFSRDGVHPSTASHKLIANALIQAINAKYGTHLAAIP